MVGVGVAEGGAGGADAYYGEYYPPEQYFVSPELCAHPQHHPQHAHMCTMHTDYGGMPVVTSAAMMPQMMPPVMDENMRHYLVPHPHQHPHHQPHHQTHLQPQHQPPPHHQPQHHYGPANGAGGPQHFYRTGYPTHFHHVPPHHMQHSPPPPMYQKDERAQRQYSKLKQKLERKQTNRNNGIEANSGASTPSLSPRKELNGRGSGGASSGAWSEGEGSSAGASCAGDDDNHVQAVLDLLTATRTPQVSDMTPTSALVTWNSPLPEGVTLPNDLTYDLLLGDRGGRYKAIYSGPSLSCRVRDLRPGSEYCVCLQIRAGSLTGAASEAATFRAPAAPPERLPAPRVTTRARTSLLLRWPAAGDNGARVSHYLLELDAGDGAGFQEAARPRTRHHTLNNLRPQTRYRIRIAAVNECGRAEWSDDTVEWTCGAPPPAPPPPQLADAGPRRLALSWERRADEEFTLQMDDAARGHGFLPVYSGPDQTYVCNNLRRATDYRFRLRCETADGQGPWSTEVTYRTHPERPSPPGRPTPKGKIHSRAFRLRWEPPAEDGGAPVELYTLELDGGEGFRHAYLGPEREAVCDRLQPGTAYRARVRCASAAGDSEWAAGDPVTTEACAPAACSAPSAATPPRPTCAALRWSPPACLGGAPLTHYALHVSEAGVEALARLAYCGLDTEVVVRELRPGCAYLATVAAASRAGTGPASPALAFTTPPAPPAAPASPALTVDTARSVRLEWTAPPDNGAPIQDYRVEMSAASVQEEAYSEVYRGVETSCVVDKLTPFSAYLFRVCASNNAGRGAWSSPADVVTPCAPPGPVGGLRCEATHSSLCLEWRPAATFGAEVTRYRVQVDEEWFESEVGACCVVVEGLAAGAQYWARVVADSAVGAGAAAVLRCETRAPPPPPPAPPALRLAAAHHTHLRLEWTPAPGADSAHYTLDMRLPDTTDFKTVYRGSARYCKVKKLKEATEYEFRIRAVSSLGSRGAWSAPLRAATPPAPPPAPRAPALSLPGPRTARLVWDALPGATYQLQCAKLKENVFRQVYSGAEPSFCLEDLEVSCEYVVRVCAVRGGLAGAWSAPARVWLPAPPPAPPAPRARHRRHRHPLTATQTALLMAGGFLLLAVAVALLVQWLVEPRP